jgi:hypothetical protein
MPPTEGSVLNMWNYMTVEPSPAPETVYPPYDLLMDVQDSINSDVFDLPTPVPLVFVETPAESCCTCTCLLFMLVFMTTFALCIRRFHQKETIVVHADGVPAQEASSIKITESNGEGQKVPVLDSLA